MCLERDHDAERVRGFLDELSREWDGLHVMLIGHSATRLALNCLLDEAVLEEVVDAPFG